MASGFVQRWKGKVLAQLLGVGSGGITLYTVTGTPNIAPVDIGASKGIGTVTAYSSQGSAISANGIANLTSTGVLSSMTLGAPIAGAQKVLALTSISSGLQVNASPATYDGTNSVLKSTVASQITLRGLSTSRWAIESVFPGSTAATSILTLSTST